MRNKTLGKTRISISLLLIILCWSSISFAQNDGVKTFMNPIMGDHADQTLMRDGDDFYLAGSSFHYNPFIPIYHSTDLVHWEVISRVVPSNWSALSSDAPSAGTWQGALAKFNGYYWLYFSNHTSGGQYFCKATDMKGPWSAPTKVSGTGVTGYDNSVFVDDDGTPYLIMKNGAAINRILKLDKTTGHSTGTVFNMDWLNVGEKYGMAEGPVMCKRNGRYYYFFAGHVYGGQWFISSATLTGDQSAWTAPQEFFTGTASLAGFTAPNHMSQPVQIADGTWWCVAHAYGQSGWRGQGRICLLYQVTWDGSGNPHSAHASANPVTAPNLANPNNIAFNFPREDYFSSTTLKLPWHFFNKANATKYSLSANPGYMRLNPGSGTTHVLQKEAGRAYTLVTKVVVNATGSGQSAGLRIQNGKDDSYVRMYAGYNGSAKIGFAYNTTTTEVNNTIGNTVWLRIDRDGHNIKGYYSADGKTWTQVGGTVSATSLDDYATNYNEWVGNSIGLYATGVTADFDFFKYRESAIPLSVAGHNNFNGVSTSTKTPGSVVSNTTNGGWLTLAGVSVGTETAPASNIIVNAASASGGGSLEVWIDNIDGAGTKIATIPIGASGGADVWKDYTANVNVIGQHDLYLKFIGSSGAFSVSTVRFLIEEGTPFVSITAPSNNATVEANKSITISADATDSDGTISKVEFYAGTTLIGTDNSSPYSISWTPTTTGSFTLTAKATDNSGKSSTSSEVIVKVNPPQSPYLGTAWAIPGKIQFENYDIGGNGFAYYDNTPGTNVDPAPNFRTDEDVDIETCTDTDGGYNLGWTTAGEWVEYTVNVATAGKYTLTLRVACNGDGRTLSITAKDVPVATDVAIPNTAGWQTWTDVTVNNIQLEAGIQIIRVTVGATDYINLNYMVFTSANVPPVVTIASPSDNAQFTTKQSIDVTVNATASGATISSVSFALDGQVINTDNTSPYAYSFSGLTVGNHTLTVEATDSNGSKASKSVTVIVVEAKVLVGLKAGWNIIGCPLNGSTAIETALSSVWSHVLVVKDFDAFYDKSQAPQFNLLTKLDWGKGYWIKVDAPCELEWIK